MLPVFQAKSKKKYLHIYKPETFPEVYQTYDSNAQLTLWKSACLNQKTGHNIFSKPNQVIWQLNVTLLTRTLNHLASVASVYWRYMNVIARETAASHVIKVNSKGC